jgi:hypothetical protein
MSERIFVVRYSETDDIEGYVKNKKDFKDWLKKHNRKRRELGEIPEKEWEFKLEEVEKLG